MDEPEWDRLVEQVKNGDCTPFLGAGASSGTLPLAAQLSSTWADRYDYPFSDKTDLAEVTQYVTTVIVKDPVTVKQRVAAELSDLGMPDFSNPSQPHAILARQPIPVFVTTNYDDFMSRALEQARKRPVTLVSPWYDGAEGDPATRFPEGYVPSVERPLVYHLHGSFEHPPSMVLTQEDYLEFLLTLAKDHPMGRNPVVPTEVLPAMTQRSLLFLGYGLRDWSFRMLFRSLHRKLSVVQHRRHVSVQLSPGSPTDPAGRRRSAEDYLHTYYDRMRITVHWDTVDQFCTELKRRLEQR